MEIMKDGMIVIFPDWVLVWKYDNDELILCLLDTGTHSDLFKK